MGLDTSHPDYDFLAARTGETREEIREKFVKLARRLKHPANELPDPVSLVSGFVLLDAVGRSLSPSLNRLNDLVGMRNYSIYAHGYSFTSERTYHAFKGLVEEILGVFLAEVGVGKDTLDELAFIALH